MHRHTQPKCLRCTHAQNPGVQDTHARTHTQNPGVQGCTQLGSGSYKRQPHPPHMPRPTAPTRRHTRVHPGTDKGVSLPRDESSAPRRGSGEPRGPDLLGQPCPHPCPSFSTWSSAHSVLLGWTRPCCGNILCTLLGVGLYTHDPDLYMTCVHTHVHIQVNRSIHLHGLDLHTRVCAQCTGSARVRPCMRIQPRHSTCCHVHPCTRAIWHMAAHATEYTQTHAHAAPCTHVQAHPPPPQQANMGTHVLRHT